MTKLVLGTAQFGTGYGITSQVDRVSDFEMGKILAVARNRVDLFDTAPEYGNAQERLGTIAPKAMRGQYISKFSLPPYPSLPNPKELYLDTLAALDTPQLYGLMFHSVDDLRDDRAALAWDILRKAREDGLVARIGASIYDRNDIAIVGKRFPDLDLIQIPGNILDRRLLDSPMLHMMHRNSVEVHVRSVYLQGLLLTAPDDVPAAFRELVPVLEGLYTSATTNEASVMDLALSFLKNHPYADAVLVGATNARELEATLKSWVQLPKGSFSFDLPPAPEHLLDPRSWPPRKRSS